MAKVFGNEMKKADILRRVGHLSQLASIRPCVLHDGRSGGTQAFEVANGSGLEFTVLKDKCLDLSNMRYKGININFLTKPGIVAPAYFNPHGDEFGRYFQAGMMYTCGLRNVGIANEDRGEQTNSHGRIGNTPAENVGVVSEWRDDEYIMEISGQMREGCQFAENMLLSRKISTALGEKKICIHDRIENQGFEEQPFMMLYHFNMGYPMLDENLRLRIPSLKREPRDEPSAPGLNEWDKMEQPIDGFVEQVFYHTLGRDAEGRTAIAVINDKLGFGVYVKFNAEMLPNLIEWKNMMSGDYTLGLEPANCHVGGRAHERALGSLRSLKPLETAEHHLEFGIADTAEEIRELEEYIASLT